MKILKGGMDVFLLQTFNLEPFYQLIRRILWAEQMIEHREQEENDELLLKNIL